MRQAERHEDYTGKQLLPSSHLAASVLHSYHKAAPSYTEDCYILLHLLLS